MEDVLAPAAATAPGGDHEQQHDREQADRLVLDLVTRHAQSLLRVARRYSYCPDDAQDAYQRAMELLMRHAHRLDPERAAGWLHTVVKHEALEVRRQRGRLVGMDEVDLERLENRTDESPEERVMCFYRV
jgi:RNA polymerase sigma factor (sigma-70 family)